MAKKRQEKYEPKIVLKEGVKFDDLIKVAVKKHTPKKGDEKPKDPKR